MSRARLVITAVVVEGRSQAGVARAYGVSPGWVSRLIARYRAEGEAAFAARSRRPNTSPTAIPASTVDLIIRLRKGLDGAGLDCGAHTIAWRLQHHHGVAVSPATIWRALRRCGLITPQPKKRPRSSYTRFEAELPNQMWQTDFTHVRLADGTDVEVLTFLDDCSRYALAVAAYRRVTGHDVVNTFRAAVAAHGIPASVLSDNGMVFTTRLSGGRGGRNGFEHELVRLDVAQKHSRPNHPTTCGKVERFQQTMKRWLRRQPAPADLTELQHRRDTWRQEYNTRRPHRSLNRAVPAAVYTTRPKASPAGSAAGPHERIRHDRVDDAGAVTLRHAGRLHHIGLGRTHARTPVIMLIQDLNIRVIHALTGQLIRELVLDPTRDYQPRNTNKPPNPQVQGFPMS